MKSYNLTEVQKYFAITNHVYTARTGHHESLYIQQAFRKATRRSHESG
jgi:hypothetical protein